MLSDVDDLGGSTIEDEMTYYPDEAASDLDSYEVLMEDVGIKACPPAAKSVVESLPSVFFTAEDIARSIAMCAVCKDEFLLPTDDLQYESWKEMRAAATEEGDEVLQPSVPEA
ncbi:hypothetical protein ZIOFF_057718 [Zingiber officinale]|uniref:Uncharacterized protein n=1 Tax=Zingiber officinale TaxID=94328 RepID=A0A8J5KAE7_ZINOF|nr:hypothetical protein ZIOFF_057718 [Zingiber officinale]